MQLRYTFRLDPTTEQRRSLAQAFGCARVVFNDGLRVRRESHAAGLPYVGDGDLLRQVTTDAKRTSEREWLGEVSAVVLQQAVADLNTAYRNFFASLSGKRKGRKVSPPRFRSRKDSRQAVRFTRNASFRVTAGRKLRLPKIGEVPVRWSRELPSDPSSVTVILDAAGRYFASFVVDTGAEGPPPSADSDIGIDLGLTTFAVMSDGRRVANPRFLRNAERRLKRAQQALSRKQKNSNNRGNAGAKVARLHAKVADTRKDWLHKESTRIIRENQAVYVEDLAVSGLARTRLAKSVHDVGWGKFMSMLEYKAARYGRTVVKVDRWFPSSQLCSACGLKDGPKPLNVRSWMCAACGSVHDRDLNAAKNILAEGRKIAAGHAVTACGAQVSPGAIPAQRREAGTPPKRPMTAVGSPVARDGVEANTPKRTAMTTEGDNQP